MLLVKKERHTRLVPMSDRVTPRLEAAIVTWYTRSWGAYNVTVKLLEDFPARYPEPGHIFFDADATVQQILDRPDHLPWDTHDRGHRTLALVVRRWSSIRGAMHDCIVGYSWYI